MAKILKAENIQTDLLGSNGNSAFSLQRNSSSLLTLNTSDNVGINTTSPTHKLEVRGSSNPKIAIVSDDVLINQGADFKIDLKNSSSTLFEGGNISIKHSASNQTDTAESAYMSFSTRNAGSVSERMRITPNGGIAFGGAANYGTTAHVLKSAGDSAPVWGFITNNNVDSAAAIAYSKLNLTSGITSSDIVNNTIVNANINSSAAIAYSKLNLSNSIVSGDIFSGSITTDKIADGAITTGKIADGAITTNKIADGAITTSKIASGAIAGGAVGGGTNKLFWENDQIMSFDYSISSGKNAFTAGPITINNSITLTIPSGVTYTIL